jgi:hypothetical protein
MVIEPAYEDVHYFSEGLALVKQRDKYGFIDGSGKVVIPLQFTNAWPFRGAWLGWMAIAVRAGSSTGRVGSWYRRRGTHTAANFAKDGHWPCP